MLRGSLTKATHPQQHPYLPPLVMYTYVHNITDACLVFHNSKIGKKRKAT